MNKEEKILYEAIVKCNDKESDIRLRITNSNIKLEKIKGLFSKKYHLIENVDINDIKIIDNKIIIFNDEEKVELETNDKKYMFTCSDKKIAKDIVCKIKKAIVESGRIDDLSKKIITKVIKTSETVGKVSVAVAGAVKCIKDTKDIIFKEK